MQFKITRPIEFFFNENYLFQELIIENVLHFSIICYFQESLSHDSFSIGLGLINYYHGRKHNENGIHLS